MLSAVEATSSCYRQFHFCPVKFPSHSRVVFLLCCPGQAPSLLCEAFPAHHSSPECSRASPPSALCPWGSWCHHLAQGSCASCKGKSRCCLWSCSSSVSCQVPQLSWIRLCPTHLCWMPQAVLFEHSGMHPSDAGERHHLPLRLPTAKQLGYVTISSGLKTLKKTKNSFKWF